MSISISAIAAGVGKKAAKKIGKKIVKAAVEPIRKKATTNARKRQGKQFIKPYMVALLMLPTLVSCSTIDNALIAADSAFYDNSTAIVVLPDGYDINPYVTDAADQRQTIDGWKIKYEIIPKADHVAPSLKDKLYQGNKGQQSSLLSDVIKAAIQEEVASQKPAESGAADAIDKLKQEAAKEGIQ